jgi:DNA-binding transcriptional LysR family regulator
MPSDIPDLELLRLFLAVADTGSIGAAARVTGSTQPAASVALRRLERQVGVELLVRTPRGSRLSPAGVAVAEWARELLGAAARFGGALDTLREHAHDELRIVASPTLADYVLPRLLGRLWNEVPDLRVNLLVDTSLHAATMLREHAADLAFVGVPRVDPDFASVRVGIDRLVVVVPPGHPWCDRPSVVGDDLAAVPLVLREPGSGSREAFDAAMATHGLSCAPQVVVGSALALKAAVGAGAGVGVVSRWVIAEDVAAGRLAVVPVGDLDLRRPVRAIWHRAAPLPGCAATMLAISAARAQPQTTSA